MRCPRCSFEGALVDGACAHCGYRRVSGADSLRTGGAEPGIRIPSMPLHAPSGTLRSPSMPLHSLSGPLHPPTTTQRSLTSASRPLSLAVARRGDTLNQGRYRLVDQLLLPDNQQGQGAAWLALDNASSQVQVVIREVLVPPEALDNKQQVVRQAALRLSEAAQHTGFPRVLDVFNELDTYFLVLQHIEGESLASLLRRQGGALPERAVAEYGRQLCEMLSVLARQQPPLVHGAISPETVIISPDRHRVHLIHLPLFPLKEGSGSSSAAGYKAPEQARGVAEPSSDLYAVAATLHHAVTGFDPRERISFFYPPVRRLNPVVSQQMETILAQELRLSAPQRYARAAEMQSDLLTLLAHQPPESERRLPMAMTDPLKMDIGEIRRQSLRRSRSQLGIFAAVCLLALMVILAVSLYPILKGATSLPVPTPNATATMATLASALQGEWQAESPLYQSKGIGLSDGRYVFDTFPGHGSAEITYKKLAARALLKGDMGTALSQYSLAVTNDKTDAETRIYYEDLQIETQNDPYVTLVLGLPLDSDSANLAITRPDLQAAFAFQNQINTQNPGPLPAGIKLRILIANSGSDTVNNSGSDDGDVAAVAQLIARRVQLGNLDHIVGVVGWPKSKESLNAYAVLTRAHIPMITQTASSVTLDGVSPYFFRVNPTDAAQGKAQGQFAYQTLGARTVLVLRDQNDPYSQSLADAFTTTFRQLGGKVLGTQSDYFTEGQTTVSQFQQVAVQDALANHVDLIFLPGFDVDGIRLARALGIEESIYGWSTYLAHLKILGGDGLDTGLILGNGIGPDATLAQTHPQDMRRLLFTSFADASEGGVQMQQFLTNWSKLYGVTSPSNPSPPLPVNTALMVNDAFGVFTYAISQIQGTLSGESVRNVLATLGSGQIRPYQGVSGQIVFGKDGDPLNKVVVLLGVGADPNGHNEIKSLGTSPTSR
jgi:ABC-type branched-subunit amino acid transport system substrate-binding protein